LSAGTAGYAFKRTNRDSSRKEAGAKVQVAKRIRKQIRRTGEGIDLAADVNATVAVNASDRGTRTRVRSRQFVDSSAPSGSARSRDVEPGKENQ
jgi:hypothetical protein